MGDKREKARERERERERESMIVGKFIFVLDE